MKRDERDERGRIKVTWTVIPASDEKHYLVPVSDADRLEEEFARLREQLGEAVEALKRYGFHDGDCPACLVDEPGPCDCGWDDAARQYLGGQ